MAQPAGTAGKLRVKTKPREGGQSPVNEYIAEEDKARWLNGSLQIPSDANSAWDLGDEDGWEWTEEMPLEEKMGKVSEDGR
jgi:hypothetical protein